MPFYTVLALLNTFLCSVVTVGTAKLLQDIFFISKNIYKKIKKNKEFELHKILNLLNKLKKTADNLKKTFFFKKVNTG